MDDIEEEEEEEAEDEDEEKERKTARLEQSLDQLYDQFQQHKSDRDARHKAKEERRKRDAAEGGDWTGIKTTEDSDDESEGDLDPAPMPSDDDDSDDDDIPATTAEGMKLDGDESEADDEPSLLLTKAVPSPLLSKRAIKAAALAAAKISFKEQKLMTKLVQPITAEKRLAAAGKRMWIVPVALKYRFLESYDPLPALSSLMDRLETRFTWRVQDHRPLVDRIYHYAEGVLGLKEFEYLGGPQSGTLLERLTNLRGRILERVEDRRGVKRRDDPIPVRVKELRRACLDALARRYPPYRSDRPPGPVVAVTPRRWVWWSAS